MSLFRPLCKGSECQLVKAPHPKEVQETTYRIGSKCYKFKTHPMDCPSQGIIEAFQTIKV